MRASYNHIETVLYCLGGDIQETVGAPGVNGVLLVLTVLVGVLFMYLSFL